MRGGNAWHQRSFKSNQRNGRQKCLASALIQDETDHPQSDPLLYLTSILQFTLLQTMQEMVTSVGTIFLNSQLI